MKTKIILISRLSRYQFLVFEWKKSQMSRSPMHHRNILDTFSTIWSIRSSIHSLLLLLHFSGGYFSLATIIATGNLLSISFYQLLSFMSSASLLLFKFRKRHTHRRRASEWETTKIEISMNGTRQQQKHESIQKDVRYWVGVYTAVDRKGETLHAFECDHWSVRTIQFFFKRNEINLFLFLDFSAFPVKERNDSPIVITARRTNGEWETLRARIMTQTVRRWLICLHRFLHHLCIRHLPKNRTAYTTHTREHQP